MKCRIWKRPDGVWWDPFSGRWQLDIPAGLKIGPAPVYSGAYGSFNGALNAFQYLLRMKKAGWLHR